MGYAATMSYPAEDVAALGAAQEVEIETQAPGGSVHRTIIWTVVDDDDVFVRSYLGPTARWYREALANPAVAVHVDGRRISSTAIPATDPDSIERTSAGFRRKYAGDPGVKAMIAPGNLDTTLRLEPA